MLIYEPKGKAREYSPLALNVYSGGCDHGCKYCYCANIQRGWTKSPRTRELGTLRREAINSSRQILLSFMADPYCKIELTEKATRKSLEILKGEECSVAILTKGGTRCLRDLDLFSEWPDGRIKIGATLTFVSKEKIKIWEPGAASFRERISALEELNDAGVNTWASIEPVIDPIESLSAIRESLFCVDAYKVGKWNHDKRASEINWREFGYSAVELIRKAGKQLYVKKDLQPYFDDGYLVPSEIDMESMSLPDRPPSKQIWF